MNKNNFHTFHSSGLVTLLSAPTTGINHNAGLCHLTKEQIKKKAEADAILADFTREREEYR